MFFFGNICCRNLKHLGKDDNDYFIWHEFVNFLTKCSLQGLKGPQIMITINLVIQNSPSCPTTQHLCCYSYTAKDCYTNTKTFLNYSKKLSIFSSLVLTDNFSDYISDSIPISFQINNVLTFILEICCPYDIKNLQKIKKS